MFHPLRVKVTRANIRVSAQIAPALRGNLEPPHAKDTDNMSTATAVKLTLASAITALWAKATEYGSDYRVAPVVAEDAVYVALIIRIDKGAPGDRITQPKKDTGMGGGNLGFALGFSQNVTIPLPPMADGEARGDFRIKGAFAIADATPSDFERLGEDRDSAKWSHLNRTAASSKRKTANLL